VFLSTTASFTTSLVAGNVATSAKVFHFKIYFSLLLCLGLADVNRQFSAHVNFDFATQLLCSLRRLQGADKMKQHLKCDYSVRVFNSVIPNCVCLSQK